MKLYVILSLKHSTETEACFWRADDAGYTTNIWRAGIYREEAIKQNPGYYNDGFNSIAICIDNSSLPYSGLRVCVNEKKLKEYRKKNLAEI